MAEWAGKDKFDAEVDDKEKVHVCKQTGMNIHQQCPEQTEVLSK